MLQWTVAMIRSPVLLSIVSEHRASPACVHELWHSQPQELLLQMIFSCNVVENGPIPVLLLEIAVGDWNGFVGCASSN